MYRVNECCIAGHWSQDSQVRRQAKKRGTHEQIGECHAFRNFFILHREKDLPQLFLHITISVLCQCHLRLLTLLSDIKFCGLSLLLFQARFFLHLTHFLPQVHLVVVGFVRRFLALVPCQPIIDV